MKDFTYSRLEIFLKSVMREGHHPVSFREFLEHPKLKEKTVIIRHDVDRNLKNSLTMAKFEQSMGICSTYYFRYPYTFDPVIIRKISDMGHEIGYHYEVITKSKGNIEKASKLFEKELEEFRKICDVKTCCAHGSPLSSFDNRTLFLQVPLARFNIIGDAHLSAPKGIAYFSDTGRSWGMQENLRDRLTITPQAIKIHSTGELQEHIETSEYPHIYLVIHPERWNPPGVQWYLQLGRDVFFNMGKRILQKVR